MNDLYVRQKRIVGLGLAANSIDLNEIKVCARTKNTAILVEFGDKFDVVQLCDLMRDIVDPMPKAVDNQDNHRRPLNQMYKSNQFNPMLSDHLDLFTLCQSETAEKLGIHNMPQDADVIENLRQLCLNVLNPAIVHFDLPLFVTSGYRCPQLNAEVGGLAQSQHLLGQAADIMMGGIRNDELAKWIIENTDFDEVILEKFDPDSGEYGWVHASYNTDNNRNRVTTFDGKTFHDGFHYFDLN